MSQPNLLILLSDQHNPHIQGYRGDAVVRTPALDKLAVNGVHFRHAYCGSPLCVPSRMSFLTGRYPSDIDVWTNQCVLGSETPTFAHALALAGYETVLCGRMHFAGSDQHHGFQHRLVGDVSGARHDDEDLFEGKIPLVTTGQSAPGVKVAGPGRSSYIAYDDDVTERACRYLATRDQSDASQPFCLVVGYLLPHSPYICPKPLFEEYMDKITLPTLPDDYRARLHPAMQRWRANRDVESITTEEARRARAAYYGLVTYLDDSINKVLSALATSRFQEDTVVVYLSDHGDMAGEHGMWWKSSFYEGSVSVPMIWSGVKGSVTGLEVNAVTSLLDVAPTLLDLGEASPLPGCRGHSLLRFLQGEAVSDWDNTAFSELYVGIEPPARMVRRGRWKLNHYHDNERPQLFDLASDPAEMNDLGQEAAHAQVRTELEALIHGDDWSAARILAKTEANKHGRAMVQSWHQQTADLSSEKWSIPPGSNQFPA